MHAAHVDDIDKVNSLIKMTMLGSLRADGNGASRRYRHEHLAATRRAR